MRTGRAEVERFARKGAEVLELTFRIGALDAGDTLGVYAWNNIANPPILFAVVVARTSLKPRYGQGFNFGTQKDYKDYGNSDAIGRGR